MYATNAQQRGSSIEAQCGERKRRVQWLAPFRNSIDLRLAANIFLMSYALMLSLLHSPPLTPPSSLTLPSHPTTSSLFPSLSLLSPLSLYLLLHHPSPYQPSLPLSPFRLRLPSLPLSPSHPLSPLYIFLTVFPSNSLNTTKNSSVTHYRLYQSWNFYPFPTTLILQISSIWRTADKSCEI